MNNIRQIQAINKRELEAGVSTSASWHRDFADTAYVYVGGLPYELSEGDIVTIFSQFGEPVFVNLVRDKETGKSKGFAFLKYEDQRSTDLAVDNLGGAQLMGRTLRVDHTRYKRKDGESLADNTYGTVGQESEDEKDDEPHREVAERESGHRKKRRKSEGEDVEEQRPLLKEERELQELMLKHDDDDPMKEYLVEQKKVEVDAALREYEAKKKGKDDGKHHRHHHQRHRTRRDDPLDDDHRDSRHGTNGRKSSRSKPARSDVDDDADSSRRRPRRRSQEREEHHKSKHRDRSRSRSRDLPDERQRKR